MLKKVLCLRYFLNKSCNLINMPCVQFADHFHQVNLQKNLITKTFPFPAWMLTQPGSRNQLLPALCPLDLFHLFMDRYHVQNLLNFRFMKIISRKTRTPHNVANAGCTEQAGGWKAHLNILLKCIDIIPYISSDHWARRLIFHNSKIIFTYS